MTTAPQQDYFLGMKIAADPAAAAELRQEPARLLVAVDLPGALHFYPLRRVRRQ
jgi:hypothetical protein